MSSLCIFFPEVCNHFSCHWKGGWNLCVNAGCGFEEHYFDDWIKLPGQSTAWSPEFSVLLQLEVCCSVAAYRSNWLSGHCGDGNWGNHWSGPIHQRSHAWWRNIWSGLQGHWSCGTILPLKNFEFGNGDIMLELQFCRDLQSYFSSSPRVLHPNKCIAAVSWFWTTRELWLQIKLMSYASFCSSNVLNFCLSVSPDKQNCSGEENKVGKVQGRGECHSFEGDKASQGAPWPQHHWTHWCVSPQEEPAPCVWIYGEWFGSCHTRQEYRSLACWHQILHANDTQRTRSVP